MRLSSRYLSPRIVILGYHSIQERPENYANSIGLGIIHSASIFESNGAGRTWLYSVTLEDIKLILSGEKNLSKHAVAVTFDDGYIDNLEIADPILRRHGISAFYLTAEWIGTNEAPWVLYQLPCPLRQQKGMNGQEWWENQFGSFPIRKVGMLRSKKRLI